MSAFMRENPKNEWNFMQFFFYKKANVGDVGSEKKKKKQNNVENW